VERPWFRRLFNIINYILYIYNIEYIYIYIEIVQNILHAIHTYIYIYAHIPYIYGDEHPVRAIHDTMTKTHSVTYCIPIVAPVMTWLVGSCRFYKPELSDKSKDILVDFAISKFC
jgi:hypothetical protein